MKKAIYIIVVIVISFVYCALAEWGLMMVYTINAPLWGGSPHPYVSELCTLLFFVLHIGLMVGSIFLAKKNNIGLKVVHIIITVIGCVLTFPLALVADLLYVLGGING